MSNGPTLGSRQQGGTKEGKNRFLLHLEESSRSLANALETNTGGKRGKTRTCSKKSSKEGGTSIFLYGKGNDFRNRKGYIRKPEKDPGF